MMLTTKTKALVFFTFFAGVFLFFVTFLWLTSPFKPLPSEVLSNTDYYIAHATGTIEGKKYLNCKESIIKSLNNGYRFIEVDLGVTTDSALVCLHDWNFFHKITIDETIDSCNTISEDVFKSRKIFGKYTPLTLADVIHLWDEYSFVIVTDKISDVRILNRYFTHNRNQVMVEAFSIKDYEDLKRAGYIPMLSLRIFDYSNVFWNFVYYPLRYHKFIEWICIDSRSNINSLRMMKRLFNCKVAMYTINSPSFFTRHLGREIDLIYTDSWNLLTQKNDSL